MELRREPQQTRRLRLRRHDCLAWIPGVGLLLLNVVCAAQMTGAQPVGTVSEADAEVSRAGGALVQVVSGRAVVSGNATVTAKPGHNAEVALLRRGSLLVCQTTALRVNPSGDGSLLLALDRGAMEIRMKAGQNDSIMTPDMHLNVVGKGELDLRMRVTFNGDTCVENRGRHSPQLDVSDAFGETSYLLKPGQHVMFERGSLRSVMDRETTPCGCPPAETAPKGVSLAEALIRQTTPVTPQQAAAAHPFPTAVSDGLTTQDSATPPVQVATTLRYDPAATADGTVPEVAAALPATEQTAKKPGPLAAVGRFFKRLFVR